MNEPFRPHNAQAAQGAALKDQELVKWLEKKLADLEGWVGRPCSNLVSQEMIEELMTCFQAIDSQSKLKIVLSYPFVNPRYMVPWRETLNGLLGIARRDPDDWVELVSEFYKDIPNTGMCNSKPETSNTYYKKSVDDMKKMIEFHDSAGNLNMNPSSYNICSTTVQKGAIGPPLEPGIHFAMKKKPKSYFYMKDMEKQSEIANQLKKEKAQGIITSLPIKMRSTRREGNNTLPMKGIPRQNTVQLSAGFTNEPKKFQRQLSKREGGAKLLDIGDLPQSLKKRRQTESEEDKKKKIVEKELAKKKAIEEKKEKEESRKAEIKAAEESRKAAEAKRTAEEKIAKEILKSPTKIKEEEEKPSPMPNQSNVRSPTKLLSPTDLSPPPQKIQKTLEHHPHAQQVQQQQQMQPPQQVPQLQAQKHNQPPQGQTDIQSIHQLIDPSMNIQSQQMSQQKPMVVTREQPLHHHNMGPTISTHQRIITPQMLQQAHLHQQQMQQQHHTQQHQINNAMHQQLQMQHGNHPQMMQKQQHVVPIQQQPIYQAPPFIVPHGQNPEDALRKHHEDTIVKQCQDMLRTANALDDTGKQMVMHFMRGGKDNPRPDLGRLVTLKLSETVEDGMTDGQLRKMKVETFFQMDYGSGEWKRLRKCRILEAHEMEGFHNGRPPALLPQPPQIQAVIQPHVQQQPQPPPQQWTMPFVNQDNYRQY